MAVILVLTCTILFQVISWSGQNHTSKITATSYSSIHVTLPPAESSKFNQNTIFALVGGLGGSIIVLVLSVIIIVQCLYKRRKVEAYPAVREGSYVCVCMHVVVFRQSF